MKIYKTGMVGFGFIGKVHAYGHMNIPLFYDQQEFKTRITHVCTSKTATAEKGAAQVGAEHAVTDYREITENPDIDIVDICTPNNLHFEALMSAIRHNKHIYCDKPLTATLDEAMQIKEALKDYKGISQMTLQNRFFPITLRAKQLIEEGKIDTTPLITNRFPLNEIEEAYRIFENKLDGVIKVAIVCQTESNK